jgi:hypothetical protein
VSKNHYSLGTEFWWKLKTPALLVTAFAALLSLVAAARSMGIGRMVRSKSICSYHFILRFIVLVNSSTFTTLVLIQQQSFRNARIAQSDLQAYGSTTVQNRGEFLNRYERSDPQSFSDMVIVHPNYVPI